jgi:hypothetical protein
MDGTIDDATWDLPTHLQMSQLLTRVKVASIHRVADKVLSRKSGCRCCAFSETCIPPVLVALPFLDRGFTSDG